MVGREGYATYKKYSTRNAHMVFFRRSSGLGIAWSRPNLQQNVPVEQKQKVAEFVVVVVVIFVN